MVGKFNVFSAALAADTCVVVDGEILGKPENYDEAKAMLTCLSGREHEVLTAVCLIWQGREHSELVSTQVEFVAIDDEDMEAYLKTEEPWDKAGAYGIQGIAAVFVRAIRGSYSNVVGLPLVETWRLLKQSGVVDGLKFPE